MSEPGRTRWNRGLPTPMRAFLQIESASAGVLVAAIVAALIWANLDHASYESVWSTTLAIRWGDHVLAESARTWVDSGLMTLFFLVIGLEARREFDLGELRDRSRVLLPAAAGLAGMAVPVAIYLAVNAGGPGTTGWGVAMSTDTALALGVLGLLGRDVPDKARTFLLTVFVVDDLVALAVITFFYSDRVEILHVAAAVVAYLLLLGALRLGIDQPALYAVLGLATWAALLPSGIDPVLAGLAIGLAAPAYTPVRGELERATDVFRRFREQPTAELARSAAQQLTSTLSPNARLQRVYHPWTSYLIVPLFGLANAGIHINGDFLAHAYTTPITLGIICGYVAGKPVGVLTASWLLTRLSRGRIRPSVGWAAVTGSGTLAGIGFTVALLIASLAFEGPERADATLGVLTAALLAAALTWAVYRITGSLPPERRAMALLGDAEQLTDLAGDIDPGRDHIRGPQEASVTVAEFGDFQCPYCGRAEPAVQAILADLDVRYVWRHLPLTDVHPQAQLAAEAAEAAAAQGAFWPMHDLLLQHQDRLHLNDLIGYAERLGLDSSRFRRELVRHTHAGRVARDVESADVSGVSGTPTFFINGQRHYGPYDVAALTAAIRTARDRARLVPRNTDR